MNRNDVLDDEFLRVTPGLRPFSVGIFRLCQKLKLAVAMPGSRPEDLVKDLLTVAWMLDLRTPLETVKHVAGEYANGGVALLESHLDEYQFTIPPGMLLDVKKEMDRTQKAIGASAVEVMPKPGEKPPASPPGN